MSCREKETKMKPNQKVVMKDFDQQFFQLLESYWNPNETDEYWDNLTEDAVSLIERFQTKDLVLNNLITTIVMAFLNSREEVLS
jgi:hypothetical protein